MGGVESEECLPPRLNFPALWLMYGFAHFGALNALVVFTGLLLPRWVGLALGLFVELGEAGLRAVMDYHGQDEYQWPLCLLNSALYGAVFAVFHRAVSSRRADRRPRNCL